LVDITVKQEKHGDEIGKIDTKIDGVSKRLAQVEESLQKVTPPAGAPEPTKSTEPRVVEFKETPEYERIAAQLSALQQQLTTVGSNLTVTQEMIAKQEELARLRDPGQAWRAMNDPQELAKRLDILSRNFSQKIEDPLLRQQFEADVEAYKQKISAKLSPQELQQQALQELTDRAAAAQDDRARERVQREIDSLNSASGEELEGRLDRYQRFQSLNQVRQLAEKYSIPRETLTDSGIIAMGREGGDTGGRPAATGRVPGNTGRGTRGGGTGRRGQGQQ
jgi:hypothetical protein